MVRFQALVVFALVCLFSLTTVAIAEEADAVMDQFFATWDKDAKVTPQAVQSLYGRRVIYYGRPMTTAQVYADKQALIRRWPNRRYVAVPGTVSKTCNSSKTLCRVGVTLAYRAENDTRKAATSGLTRITLSLSREAGALKIVRESGSRVAPSPGVSTPVP